MKSLFASLLALALGSTVASTALASDVSILPVPPQSVVIPAEMTNSEALGDYVSELLAVQLAELTWVEAQTTYYEIMRASFVGSRAMSQAFDSKVAQTGTKGVATGVTVALDIYLAKAWLSGATPTAMMIKDIVFAARGNTGRMTAIGQKTLASLVAMGKSLKVPKNFVTTAAIGGFLYIQVENFFVVNLSEAQYNAVMSSLDSKIAALVLRKANIADMHIPYSVR